MEGEKGIGKYRGRGGRGRGRERDVGEGEGEMEGGGGRGMLKEKNKSTYSLSPSPTSLSPPLSLSHTLSPKRFVVVCIECPTQIACGTLTGIINSEDCHPWWGGRIFSDTCLCCGI